MKKIISMILLSLMIASLSACAPTDDNISDDPDTPIVEDTDEDQEATKDEDNEEDKLVELEEEEEEEEEEEKQEEQEEEVELHEVELDEEEEAETYEKDVDLYFANAEYIELGDEDLDRVKAEKRTINYDNELILEEALVRELLNGPEDKEQYDTGIPEDVKLIDVEMKENIAYVNFEKEGMEGGSLQETLTLEQIITSLLNLETVDKVQFLLNGEVSESLMGHISTTEPFDTIPE